MRYFRAVRSSVLKIVLPPDRDFLVPVSDHKRSIVRPGGSLLQLLVGLFARGQATVDRS